MKLKEKIALIGAGLLGLVLLLGKMFSKKPNTALVKDLYDETKKNYELEIASNHAAVDHASDKELLRDGEVIIEPESKD